MAGEYQVFDHRGRSLTGKDRVDREVARRIYMEARDKSRGRSGEKPTLVRNGQEKELASRE